MIEVRRRLTRSAWFSWGATAGPMRHRPDTEPARAIPIESTDFPRDREPRLEHGGALRRAAIEYGIPLRDWLDLSTGINPRGWSVPPLSGDTRGDTWGDTWARLPEPGDGLEEAAAAYYRAPAVLAVAGSQAAIQALPGLRAPGVAGLPDIGYREHAWAWQRAGHSLVSLPDGDPTAGPDLDRLDVLVVINPNNPTGRLRSRAILLDWHARLASRGGWLVVDEAFMDTSPEESLAPWADRPGLIVLRSLGKFFGLAGARVGFVLAQPALLDALDGRLGPWTVNGPARQVARLALTDRDWQTAARLELRAASRRLADTLTVHGLAPRGGTPLFQWVCTGESARLQDRLARDGILVRRFVAPDSLRFGLPATEAHWDRLRSSLAAHTRSRCFASDPGSRKADPGPLPLP